MNILQTGTKLKAKDDTLMIVSKNQYLTKGRVYTIFAVESPAFEEFEYFIIDDMGTDHAFDAKTITDYFEVLK